jgi:O-glycosyl hydrolase
MVIVAVNKSTGPTTAEILVTHPVDFGRAQTWQIGASSASPIRGADLAPGARNAFRLEMPASSVTTLVLTR